MTPTIFWTDLKAMRSNILRFGPHMLLPAVSWASVSALLRWVESAVWQGWRGAGAAVKAENSSGLCGYFQTSKVNKLESRVLPKCCLWAILMLFCDSSRAALSKQKGSFSRSALPFPSLCLDGFWLLYAEVFNNGGWCCSSVCVSLWQCVVQEDVVWFVCEFGELLIGWGLCCAEAAMRTPGWGWGPPRLRPTAPLRTLKKQ